MSSALFPSSVQADHSNQYVFEILLPGINFPLNKWELDIGCRRAVIRDCEILEQAFDVPYQCLGHFVGEQIGGCDWILDERHT
jgi:hypothetical protein